ncbi:hypothetical protein JTB14_020297 [Gonioctena quinquepunctata]|nr:hypothetical protein JTB14_020297 [Gonioctena quinquepunctata]
MEKLEILKLRLDYLRKIEQFRKENLFFFTDRTCLHSDYTKKYNWSTDTNSGFKNPVSEGHIIIIVSAGHEDGFAEGSRLRWISQSEMADYHEDMHFDNYKKCKTKKRSGNLLPRSVIVSDNIPYHNKQENENPTSASTILHRRHASPRFIGNH